MRTATAFRLRVVATATGPAWYADTLDDSDRLVGQGSVACACAAQAACMVTRHGRRPLDFRGATDRHGAAVDVSACPVPSTHWTWRHHGHTHGPGRRALRLRARQ